MKYRKLRIAWSVACGVLCLLLIALWVRSHWRYDKVWWRDSSKTCCSLESNTGLLYVERLPILNTNAPSRGASSGPAYYSRSIFGNFLFDTSPNGTYLLCPHWTLVVVALAATVAPWIHWRFSVRTLLIGMTVVAVAVAMIASAES
jgi:hypothetical protein